MDGMDLSIVASLKPILAMACALPGTIAPGLVQSSAVTRPIGTLP